MKSTIALLLSILAVTLGAAWPVRAKTIDPPTPPPVRESTPIPKLAPGSAIPPLDKTLEDGITYFGGTTWNAAAQRWEAIPGGTWTFDSGVGSSFDHGLPGVNPFKDPSRHATMEGWIGKDATYPDADKSSYFRRLGTADIPCAVISGNYSMHAGVTAAEAEALCYASTGPGYGNGWNAAVERTFVYSSTSGVNVTLQFDFIKEMEDFFDMVEVSIRFPNVGPELHYQDSLTGTGSGTKTIVIDPLFDYPGFVEQLVNEPVSIVFTFLSDQAYSDQDGIWPTACGGFSFDNVQVSGGGIAYSADFESDAGGWTLAGPEAGYGGDYSDIVALADIDLLGQACASLQDSVLVFADDAGGHNSYQNNFAMSPWIDLATAGLVDAAAYWVEFDIGASLPGYPALDYNYVTIQVQSFPGACAIAGDGEWISTGFVYPYPDFTCDRFAYDLTNLIAPGAERVRVGLGFTSYCSFYSNCTGQSNSTPWFDNVRFGTAQTLLSGSLTQQARDGFDGFTLGNPVSQPDRFDMPPPDGITPGDTLVVMTPAPAPIQEVQIMFSPTPGASNATAFLAWRDSHAYEAASDRNWYYAKLDTAAIDATTVTWRTTYREDDPAFSGSDTDLDPADPGHLRNDIFPDDLFGAQSRIEYFYRARTNDHSSGWIVWPDTTGGRYLEYEVLPTFLRENNVLYVDATGTPDSVGGSQDIIESALAALLPEGSSNSENTAWDRFDLTYTGFDDPGLSSRWPNLWEYYDVIIWNSGDAPIPLSRADAGFLSLFVEVGNNSLFLSGSTLPGTMLAEGNDTLLRIWLGVDLVCPDITVDGCPGPAADPSSCFRLFVDPSSRTFLDYRDPLVWAIPQLGTTHLPLPLIQPWGSPPFGAPLVDESYIGGNLIGASSVSNREDTFFGFKTVLDVVPLDRRSITDFCLLENEVPGATGRLAEVLTFFGRLDPAPTPVRNETVLSRLGRAWPNPFTANTVMSFELGRAERVSLDVFDLKGRLVRTLVNQDLTAGAYDMAWDGRDGRGQEVSAGIYFYRLKAGNLDQSRKIILVR